MPRISAATSPPPRKRNGRASAVPDELIDVRYQASIEPEVVANPPLRRPSGLRTLWRMDLTRDKRLRTLTTPTLVLWGRDDKVNRPAGGPMLLNLMPNAELVMTSQTGHWMQWEAPDAVNAPVLAVPTSVGYGANFGGLAPLLGMLNSCASNVTVVNIDNGFGAGYATGQAAAPTETRGQSAVPLQSG